MMYPRYRQVSAIRTQCCTVAAETDTGGIPLQETIHLSWGLLQPATENSKYSLVAGLMVYFLYFEFIALIVKYFQVGYHFPLRYIIYIGITAIVRLIIVEHPSSHDVLLYAGAILVMVMTLWLCNSPRLKRE